MAIEILPPSPETAGAWVDLVILGAVALTVLVVLAVDCIASSFGVHRQ